MLVSCATCSFYPESRLFEQLIFSVVARMINICSFVPYLYFCCAYHRCSFLRGFSHYCRSTCSHYYFDFAIVIPGG